MIKRYNQNAQDKHRSLLSEAFQIEKPALLTYENPFTRAKANLQTGLNNVAVSSGFLELPIKHQKAIFVHELAHHMEPALTKKLQSFYRFVLKSDSKAIITFNASRRKQERNADDLVATLGYGDELATFFRMREKLHAQVEKETHLVAAHAEAHGFQIDEKKYAELIEQRTVHSPDTHKQREKLKAVWGKREKITASAKSLKERVAPEHPSDEIRAERLESWSDKTQQQGPDEPRSRS